MRAKLLYNYNVKTPVFSGINKSKVLKMC